MLQMQIDDSYQVGVGVFFQISFCKKICYIFYILLHIQICLLMQNLFNHILQLKENWRVGLISTVCSITFFKGSLSVSMVTLQEERQSRFKKDRAYGGSSKLQTLMGSVHKAKS